MASLLADQQHGAWTWDELSEALPEMDRWTTVPPAGAAVPGRRPRRIPRYPMDVREAVQALAALGMVAVDDARQVVTLIVKY